VGKISVIYVNKVGRIFFAWSILLLGYVFMVGKTLLSSTCKNAKFVNKSEQ
jgi:hypothetical protein